MTSEAGGQLNRRSKEIVILFDGFAGCGADSYFERALGIGFRMPVQFTLNLNRASDCACS